jgi:Protein of unknown function (DUF4256)
MSHPETLLQTLKTRFEKNRHRHPGVEWATIQAKLESNAQALRSLGEMESTGGEPDVTHFDSETGEITFIDCSPESPKGRRSLCYDRAALDARKEFKPESTAVDMAQEMGVEILTEEEFKAFQLLGPFDQKTSSWLKAPPEVRKLGGAIFGDFRYGRPFVFHNGADSYYASRGFRGKLTIK